MASAPGVDAADQLFVWYNSIHSVKLDIVGDFAGKELFAVHGESLLLHCIAEANVDFEPGFQVVHAVYAVENFLRKMKDRGCNFHILWFDNHEELCSPPGSKSSNNHKYLLARMIMIQHLRSAESVSNGPGQLPFSFSFPSVDSSEFRQYLTDHAVRLFLCRDGRQYPDSQHHSLSCIGIIYSHVLLGYAVAVIEDLEFTSSKMRTSVIFSKGCSPPDIELPEPGHSRRNRLELLASLKDELLSTLPHRTLTSVREAISLIAISHILSQDQGPATKKSSAIFLLHLAVLRNFSLVDRACKAPTGDILAQSSFLAKVSWLEIHLLDDFVADRRAVGLDWDGFDLLDGRLFYQLHSNVSSFIFSKEAEQDITVLFELLKDLSGIDISDCLGGVTALDAVEETSAMSPLPMPSPNLGKTASPALHFTHPVFDEYLKDVHIATDKSIVPEPASKIFQELTHWHTSKRSVDPKQIAKPKGFFARRRDQWFMADTIAYSASLTNSAGKSIEPEIISAAVAASQDRPSSEPDWKKALRTSKAAKANKKKNQGNSGTEKALEAARALRAEKTNDRSEALLMHWTERLHEFEREPDLVKRYLVTVKYYNGLSPQSMSAVGPEITLYLCSILAQLWAKTHEQSSLSVANGPEILAILMAKVVDLSRDPLHREIYHQTRKLVEAFRLPPNMISLMPAHQGASPRKLPFKVIPNESSMNLSLPRNPVEFQLAYCGPYLERSFSSAPDPRVPFDPDSWQREVLDAIDLEKKSLFVVAPTSAGKTFISFYAMKKILQSNDDDVLVYVAPTKALVNQIAAEIQARFSKTYKHEGRSVWGIHTRDNRVNNPTGCQILVCVPHILQIMLLGPANAERPTSWSNRIKRIIFDEVHCIGQAEDGIIWEQLLLLAPCPIIALSATVGNPLEFMSWLEETQKAKGFDLQMIVHEARYSDLRKFTYTSRKAEGNGFQGLERPQRLYVPGLDQDLHGNSVFHLVHPIGAIANLNRGTLGDMTLEARDCLSLWECMKKNETKEFPVDEKLRPENFLPPLLKKADVLDWERALKSQLEEWIKIPNSPFSAVRAELRETLPIPAIDRSSRESRSDTALSLLSDLLQCGALPAILFNFDRSNCEDTLRCVLEELVRAEEEWKTGPEWDRTMKQYSKWKREHEKSLAKPLPDTSKRKGVGSSLSKLEIERQSASREWSIWEGFDPEAPVQKFSFADPTKLPSAELQEKLSTLKRIQTKKLFVDALERGIAVHHAGMSRQYRQVVEMLFRKGFLTVVIATGTLALGINMPCKTVVFSGDSIFLTALNYRQASGRAGRRGFDVLGNVVFHGINSDRVFEIVSSSLPDLRGHFPVSTTLVLRVLNLLHHTHNSEYAVGAAKSLLSQGRVYLGGPAARMSIKHHVRFSIEYLRRQHMLSAEGVPLNFSGLVGHLYFTENAVFAFHSLLKSGYFHELCQDIDRHPRQVLLDMMLVLCHLFCRRPCFKYREEQWLKDTVRRSASIVLLPPLPAKALDVLKAHNRETLEIFRSYAATYVDQHLSGTPEQRLPFTDVQVGPTKSRAMGRLFDPLPPTTLRSPFAALSGFTDSFQSIHELCSTVRAGVFLEDSAVPYIPIYPDETKGVPWNAYIYDFFKHGQLATLVNANGIKSGDVWFWLKDFSLILMTIATSLTNFIDPTAAADDDDAMIGLQEDTYAFDERSGQDEDAGGAGDDKRTGVKAAVPRVDTKTPQNGRGKSKKDMLASWEDEDNLEPAVVGGDEHPSMSSASSANRLNKGADDARGLPWNGSSDRPSEASSAFTLLSGSTPAWAAGDDATLLKVHKAFCMLQEEFGEKLKRVGA